MEHGAGRPKRKLRIGEDEQKEGLYDDGPADFSGQKVVRILNADN